MMDCKLSWTLIAVSLMVLIGSAAGCISVVREGAPTSTPQETTALPVIKSFAASPATISTTQQITLSWDVSGAKTITIQPEIGTVSPSGSLQLSPLATITYTLTATNQAGSSTTSSVTITVTSTGKPDLTITDVWLSGETIYYKIKNQGSVDAKPSRSELYIIERKEADDYVDSLAAGEERTETFSNWEWRYEFPLAGAGPTEIQQYTIKVCADTENTIDEIDEGNNCKSKVLGQSF